MLNYIGKLLEKIVAEELSIFCKANFQLHKGQIGVQKNRCAIDVVGIMVEKVHRSLD